MDLLLNAPNPSPRQAVPLPLRRADQATPSFGAALQQAQARRGNGLVVPDYVRKVLTRQGGGNPMQALSLGEQQALPTAAPASGQTASADTRRAVAPAAVGAAVVKDGLTQIGKPYVFGANDFGPNPGAFDCSSFSKWLYGRQGIALPRTAQAQYDSIQHVSAAQARAGDLVFFENTYDAGTQVTHVGVLMGDGRMVDASGEAVRIDSLSAPYWSQRIVGYGRPGAPADPTAAAALQKQMAAESQPAAATRKEQATDAAAAASTAQAAPAPAPAPAAAPATPAPAQETPPPDDVAGISKTELARESGGPAKPLKLSDYPRPADDTGRGLHWIPTTAQSPAVVDRFVKEAKEMHVSWVVFLNDGAQAGDNDYLVKQLNAAGIMPIMRVLTHRGAPIQGDLTAMVKHYKALGVQYFQLYNEPNLPSENQDKEPSVKRYVDQWLPAAQQVIAGGGLPGIGSLAPCADVDDVAFFRDTLREIERRGQKDVLNSAWVGVHNYLLGAPGTALKDDPGFQRPAQYAAAARDVLGRDLPMIGTEGGFTPDRPEPADAVQRAMDAFNSVHEDDRPYDFAYTYWLIANEAGGGNDPNFTRQALIRPDGASPLVDAMKEQP